MFDNARDLARSPLLVRTAKVTAAIAVATFMATQWLASGGLDRPQVRQLAISLAAEPLTTGSIPSGAASTRLDPCSAGGNP
jgi:hypothetical protein